jgi:hypothetical protein
MFIMRLAPALRVASSIGWFLLAAAASRADTLFEDDFTLPRGRYELLGGPAWKMGDGLCRFTAPDHECYAVANLDECDQLRLETTVRIDRRLTPGYVMAGLTTYLDSENHWRLLLVAGPDQRTYFELVERREGVHQAQAAPPPAGTRLAGKQEGDLRGWEYGQEYHLTLTLSPEAIVGEVRQPNGKGFWRSSYAFASGRAVRWGRPGLTAGGVQGAMRKFQVTGPALASQATLAVRGGAAGSVAIVADQAQRVAPALEPLFAQAGFGVTRVSWDEFQPGRLSAAQVDLVVLADARQMPASAAAATKSLLRSGGKVIALGAPAFGQLLLKSPRGYVTRQQYPEMLYDTLAKRPIAFSLAWQHGCYQRDRRSTIEREPAGNDSSASPIWKATMDFEGWDNFGQPIAGAFAGGHNLLCFLARGDAQTPQLSVECIEQDHSRWIATVELSTNWRAVVLRPSDFGYWHDSPAGRNRAGDRFNPANVARMVIGLSRSHTPQCEPGKHVFWIRDLATAADPNPEEPDFQVPQIEGLCPSYGLYPLPGSFALREAAKAGDVGASPRQSPLSEGEAARLSLAAYAPVPREPGLGFDRQRACRWVRLLDAYDHDGRNRGSLVWMMLGENTYPGAIWASVGVADPAALVEGPAAQSLQPHLLKLAKAMARGCFFLEAGSRYFSYHPGEPIDLGALVANAGHRSETLSVSFVLRDAQGRTACQESLPLSIPAGERRAVSRSWTPGTKDASAFPYTLTVRLLDMTSPGQALDVITHRIDLLPDRKAGPEEYVRVEGSQFMLGGKPWHMLGINYWPNSQGGRPTVPFFQREYYNPELIEQDLAWMQAAGINLLSGIQGPVFEPDSPGAYRDLQDFVERCHRHGMKLFYFLRWGNPMHGADPEAIQRHLEAAGLKDHPAILAWELAWEPIYYSGPANGQMDFLLNDWNAWIMERYGSLEHAERDWGFKLPRVGTAPALAALPEHGWCAQHGPWDRAVAAFRRFFDDHVGMAYGQLIRQLRADDPKHLITFRFGACGIPEGFRFAHSHSASVAKHVDFLCPEGYNLQTNGGPSKLTPADAIRQGGLVTLYYRFLSREKPVVWMEFGYTVNGMHKSWKTGDEHVLPTELANQRAEFENFYKMFLESGARGAAPWWLPGGFRLGENSDFGILEPDGTERPACEVLKEYLPRFAQVPPHEPAAIEWLGLSRPKPKDDGLGPLILLDFDAHYPDAWERYSQRYLSLVQSGQVPRLLTDGTGSNSSNCPLVAVGNTPLDGHNPPKYLNAEFNAVEIKTSDGRWREIRSGKTCAIAKGESVRCRASLGNTGEAAWLASDQPGSTGVVYLTCHVEPLAAVIEAPLAVDAAYLADTQVREFTIPASSGGEQRVTLQVQVRRKSADGRDLVVPFGQKWSFVIKASPQ